MKTFLLLVLISVGFYVSAEEVPLVVGTTSGYAPYVSLDEKGNYEGFDIDFSRLLAEKMKRKLVIEDCGNMPNLLLALQQNKIDVIIWALSITEERLEKMEMVYYQGEKVTQMPFLFWETIPEGIQSIDDLANDPKRVVTVEAGSFQEGVLKKYPKVRSKQVEKITDALMEIRFGKSQVAMVDPSLISRLTSRYPRLQVLYLPLKQEDYALGNGVCINKSNPELAAEVKKVTEELIRDGSVATLERKWNLGG